MLGVAPIFEVFVDSCPVFVPIETGCLKVGRRSEEVMNGCIAIKLGIDVEVFGSDIRVEFAGSALHKEAVLAEVGVKDVAGYDRLDGDADDKIEGCSDKESIVVNFLVVGEVVEVRAEEVVS